MEGREQTGRPEQEREKREGSALTIVKPTTHVRDVHGFAFTAGDDCMAIACIFWPMLIITEPRRPIRMPSTTLHDSAPLPSSSLQQ